MTHTSTGTLQGFNASEIIATRTEKLRSSPYESEIARFHKTNALTANFARDRAKFAILDHHDNGGIIRTAKGAILDIERMETRGEEFVYTTKSEIVYLLDHEDNDENKCPLVRLDEAFKASSRRTMNHLFAKIDNPSSRCVDIRRLPLMFWLDVAMAIMQNR